MKWYLAGRYSRREELFGYSEMIRAAGDEVTSSWLFGEHEATELGGVATAEDKRSWAAQDIIDVDNAHCIVLFTDTAGRGGRHVEFGYALAQKKAMYVVGPQMSVFEYLPQVKHYDTFHEFFLYEVIGCES